MKLNRNQAAAMIVLVVMLVCVASGLYQTRSVQQANYNPRYAISSSGGVITDPHTENVFTWVFGVVLFWCLYAGLIVWYLRSDKECGM